MNPNPKIFLIVYGISVVLSLFIAIPAIINTAQFDGHCMLYAKGNFSLTGSDGSTSSTFILSEWGNSNACNYILILGIFILVLSLLLFFKTFVLVLKGFDRLPFASFLVFIVSGVIFVATLIAAMLNTVGYNAWCSNLLKVGNTLVCDETDLSKLDADYFIYTGGFFRNFHVTQFGLWSSFCVWLVGVILAFFKIYSYHQQDELMLSLAYEKEKLLTRRMRYEHVESSNVGA